MNYPFFSPSEVHAEALFLIGYRMYPYSRVTIHPRLTLLAGGNGAGKTTLLDALQTILIADQRYLHLNVAAGQNDRDLGGQLQGRVAWAVLQLKGHSEVGAIGVHLARRATAEYVDLKPFALMGTTPERDFFIDREKSILTQDLRELNARVKHASEAGAEPGARVKEFGSLNDYHRFLYEEGLSPLDFSRGGRRQFSLLWRQATQPHLGELNNFLQQTLCHEPERKLTFEDVERLMRERLHAERQLSRLGELKELDTELKGVALDLDHHRRRALGMGLAQAVSKQKAIEREIEEGEDQFRRLDEQSTALKEELDRVRAGLADLDRERDKYLREQGEWGRKYKHYQEYSAHRRLREELREEITYARQDLYPLDGVLLDLRTKIEKQREEMQTVTGDLTLWKEKEAELERQVRKWRDFRKDLERAGQMLQRDMQTRGDLEAAWQEINEARGNIQELKPLRQLLTQWESRAKANSAALELARKMIDLWPDFFAPEADRSGSQTCSPHTGSGPLIHGNSMDRALLDKAQAELRDREKEIAVRRDVLAREKKSLNGLIEELSRGRLPLPRAAAKLVEEGIASPYVNQFDSLSLEEAAECQELIGPLARAVMVEDKGWNCEPATESSQLCELARGNEPFLLVLSTDARKDFRILERTAHGTIAGLGKIGWYTPDGPVWIGAEARREQIKRAQDRLLEIAKELQDLTAAEDLVSNRLRAIQNLLPKLDALSDLEASLKASELSERVKMLERTAPHIERLYPVLQKLFQRSELFSFVHAPGQSEQLKARIAEAEARRRAMDETLEILRSDEVRTSKEQAEFQARFQELRRDLERIQTICSRLEEEEPEEVLQGRVDFGKTEELTRRIQKLGEEKEKSQNALALGERGFGELRNRYRTQSETLARLEQDLARAGQELEKSAELWKHYYPREEPQPLSSSHANEREQHKAVWDGLTQALRSRLSEVSVRYDLKLPEEEQPDRLVTQLLQFLLPPGIEINHLEEQYSRLQRELEQIEYKIKSHVEEIRSSVENEIRRLRMHLSRVNRILSALRFGRIKKIYLELEELPAYEALKKLESVLRLISRKEVVTLKEFTDQIRAFILKEANTTLSEEQIADYRSYIRIRRVIVDKEDHVRETGLSSGETLGVNLALCLSILFFIGREQGGNRESGMLLLALDEAERLDAKALETIRDLLNEVRCQLTVAMPRPVDIPDSICHLLTPLAQGVTHVHLYRKTDNGNGAAEISD
jgi:chromosome partition protein MukB